MEKVRHAKVGLLDSQQVDLIGRLSLLMIVLEQSYGFLNQILHDIYIAHLNYISSKRFFAHQICLIAKILHGIKTI